VRPDGAQRNQESAIHHTLEVRREAHAHIGEMLLGKTGDEPKKKQAHAMKHQSAVTSFDHCELPFFA
jgi:hypothetical protein